MCVVRGRVQHLDEQYVEDEHCKKALQKVDQLIELSEKARELENIVGEPSDRKETDLVTLIETVVERIDRRFPAATLTIEAPEEVAVSVLPSFERAIEELIENAAKHGSDAPEVTVTVRNVPNAFEILIADDGPGLSEPEQKVLRTGVETPLVHGTGLGLWLVYWIVTSHEGDIEATVREAGTTMHLSIPRKGETSAQQKATELQRARDRYQAAFEEAFDAMVVIDDEARIVDANGTAPEVYGLEKSELLGRSVEEFLPKEFDFEHAWSEFKRAGKQRDTVTVRGGDGMDRLVEYAATTDIVPGQHLLIVRQVADGSPVEVDDRSTA